jgi:hypothetical protein
MPMQRGKGAMAKPKSVHAFIMSNTLSMHDDDGSYSAAKEDLRSAVPRELESSNGDRVKSQMLILQTDFQVRCQHI